MLFLISITNHKSDLSHLNYYKRTFRPHMLYSVFSLLIGITIGLDLGLENLLRKRKEIGKWKLNLSKLLLAGIPIFYLITAYLFLYSGNYVIFNIIAYPLIKSRLYEYLFSYYAVLQIIFGYILVTSFYKTEIVSVLVPEDPVE